MASVWTEQPIFDIDASVTLLSDLMSCPTDQRIAVEASLQNIASVIVMHERFGMA